MFLKKIIFLHELSEAEEFEVSRVEKKYDISLLPSMVDKEVTALFLKTLGQEDCPPDSLEQITLSLKTVVERDIVPSLLTHNPVHEEVMRLSH